MLIHDIALQGLHVVLGVDRAGLVGADGPTHHGCQDVGFLTQIPGMTVYAPGDFNQLRRMLRTAVEEETGPVAVRYPRGGEDRAYPPWQGQAATVLEPGQDITLVSYGVMTGEVLDAAALLRQRGIRAEVIMLHRIAPLDISTVMASVARTGRLLVLEDCFANGSIGQQLAAALAERGCAPGVVLLKNLGQRFAGQGTIPQLRAQAGLDAAHVADAVWEVLQ